MATTHNLREETKVTEAPRLWPPGFSLCHCVLRLVLLVIRAIVERSLLQHLKCDCRESRIAQITC